MLADVVLAVYGAALLVLIVQGIYAGRILLVWRPTPSLHLKPPATLPMVTVQLPVYNEGAVLARLLDSVMALDYPADRLEVQVLDDSTDSSATARIIERVRSGRYPLHHVIRAHRTDYKAGALRHGMDTARGELLAVFDADFTPDADFLARVLGAFNDPQVAFVQARWAHRNAADSIVTRAQALLLDAHFHAEQGYRSQRHLMISFNGSAGVWRRSAIMDAGGWQGDTLTEDVDLAYRAQLRGWRAVYLNDVTVPADLPVTLPSLVAQQVRWTKGTAQTAVKLLPKVLVRQNALPLGCRLEATMHLTSGLVYPAVLIVVLLQLPLLLIGDLPSWLWLPTIVPVITALMHRRVQGRWGPIGMALPAALLGTMGMAVRNTRAVIEAIAHRPSPFERTPKNGEPTGAGSSLRRADATLEVVLATYLFGCMVMSVHAGWYPSAVFQLGLAAAFGVMGLAHILHICTSRSHTNGRS